jgi:hypothetical protein
LKLLAAATLALPKKAATFPRLMPLMVNYPAHDLALIYPAKTRCVLCCQRTRFQG